MPGTFSPSPQVSDPDMHHGTLTSGFLLKSAAGENVPGIPVPWCMPGSLTSGFLLKSAAGENVPGIPGTCATCIFTYLVRGPWEHLSADVGPGPHGTPPMSHYVYRFRSGCREHSWCRKCSKILTAHQQGNIAVKLFLIPSVLIEKC